MSEAPKPNIAVSLFTLHKVITRGLEVSIKSASQFSESGFPDEFTAEGYLNYLRAMISILNSHHLVEDELAFPYFKDKLPQAPFDALSAQHHEMVPMLGEIQTMIAKIETKEQVKSGLKDLLEILTRLNDAWHAHIPIEEKNFDIAVLDAMLPVDEHLRLIKQYSEHSQENSGPPYLTIPFILYNLPPETRNVLAKGMPEELTQKLVPIVWKDRWESMGEFLLD